MYTTLIIWRSAPSLRENTIVNVPFLIYGVLYDYYYVLPIQMESIYTGSTGVIHDYYVSRKSVKPTVRIKTFRTNSVTRRFPLVTKVLFPHNNPCWRNNVELSMWSTAICWCQSCQDIWGQKEGQKYLAGCRI